MNAKLAFILLFFLPFIVIGQQRVILESEDMTEEQKRVQKIEEKVRKLSDDYAMAYREYENIRDKIRPNNVVLSPTLEKLQKKILDIEQVQYDVRRLNLERTCGEINSLNASIGERYEFCHSLKNQVKRLNESHKAIVDQIASLQRKQEEETTAKINEQHKQIEHKNKISSLDNEISNLDALLESSKVKKSKKTRSLDDFLAENRKTNSKSKKSNSLDDLLASLSNKTATKSNSLDAMLSSTNNTSNSNSLDDLLSTSSNESDYKIDYKNDLTGVVNSRGKVLIPYKDWEIVEYKTGIAKVRKKIDSKSCGGTCTAYKEGFVDSKGMFIDGFEIDFSFSKAYSYSNNLVIVARPMNQTASERAASDREAARRKAIQKKKRELERKKCEIEINNWKRSIISKYN